MSRTGMAELSEDDYHEWLGRWWAMRQMAFDLGLAAERQLLRAGALVEEQRKFMTREELRRLTVRQTDI